MSWYGYIDLGDHSWMLVTEFRYWWHLLDVSAWRLCLKIEDVGDKNGQNRHQHLKVVTNTFVTKIDIVVYPDCELDIRKVVKVIFRSLMPIENAINSDCQDLMDPCKEKLISFTPTKKIVALKTWWNIRFWTFSNFYVLDVPTFSIGNIWLFFYANPSFVLLV